MKKSILSFGVLTLAAILTLAATALVAPQEAEAGRCFCTPLMQTGVQSADGPSCSSAVAILHNQLEDSTGCDAFCQSDLTLTMNCTPNPAGGFWVSGFLKYKCEECIFTEL